MLGEIKDITGSSHTSKIISLKRSARMKKWYWLTMSTKKRSYISTTSCSLAIPSTFYRRRLVKRASIKLLNGTSRPSPRRRTPRLPWITEEQLSPIGLRLEQVPRSTRTHRILKSSYSIVVKDNRQSRSQTCSLRWVPLSTWERTIQT